MEQEYTATSQSAAFNQALSPPHFDEDSTLLSARPVVPLHEVKAETRSKLRKTIGLTIVAAVFGGAIGAMLLLMQSGQNSSGKAEAHLSQPVESSGASGGLEPNPVESKAQLPAVMEDKPTTKEWQRGSASIVDSRQPAAISRSSAKPAKASKTVEERGENREAEEWELRRAERREARRFNRETRRERRNRREQTGDDLLRIREIFEGSPRPQ